MYKTTEIRSPIETPDLLKYIFRFFSAKERLRLTSVCKTWRAVVQDRYYWLNLLAEEAKEAGVTLGQINDLVEPHGVYQRYMKIKARANTSLVCMTYLQGIRLSLPHMLDTIEGIRQHFSFIGQPGCSKPNLNSVIEIGYLPFVQYLIEKTHEKPNVRSLGCAAKSDSLPLVQYLIETYHLTPDTSMVNGTENIGIRQYLQHVLAAPQAKAEISKELEMLHPQVKR